MIFLASDHGGFALKTKLKAWMQKQGIKVQDGGTDSEELTDFGAYAKAGAQKILSGECEKAILICGTGIGMSIQANRFKGIRAVATDRINYVRLARQHNDANVLCLAGRFLRFSRAKILVATFLNTQFLSSEERYAKRNAMLDE